MDRRSWRWLWIMLTTGDFPAPSDLSANLEQTFRKSQLFFRSGVDIFPSGQGQRGAPHRQNTKNIQKLNELPPYPLDRTRRATTEKRKARRRPTRKPYRHEGLQRKLGETSSRVPQTDLSALRSGSDIPQNRRLLRRVTANTRISGD